MCQVLCCVLSLHSLPELKGKVLEIFGDRAELCNFLKRKCCGLCVFQGSSSASLDQICKCLRASLVTFQVLREADPEKAVALLQRVPARFAGPDYEAFEVPAEPKEIL